MDFDFEHVIRIIIEKVDELERSSGDEFLEIFVSEIRLSDGDGNRLDTLAGLEYGLSRSRHWDRTNENTVIHDGIIEEHLFDALEDLEFPEETENVSLQLLCEGMTDLEEPINYEFEIKINYGK